MIYANGDLATVERTGPPVSVRVRRTDRSETVVEVTRNNWAVLSSARRKAREGEHDPPKLSDDGRRELIGQLTYTPLRVAYATTVHKSQGLSLDEVQVDTRANFFHVPGMLYVALSRARSMQGLRIVGTRAGLMKRCTVHRKVRPWV